jgi:23S rRNA pseudouridine2605 synthase
MEERLQKILARAGVASRRAAEEMMVQGRVTVNGEHVKELGTRADASKDDIRVDGVRVRAAVEPVYLLLYKPKGVITTKKDPGGRPTVMDLVPKIPGLFPVGRLDVGTEGLLIMTNDGAFAQRVSHPSYEVERVYHAKVRGVPTPETMERLRKGLRVDGEQLAVDRVRIIEAENNSWVEVTLHEGKHHEVRRLLEAVGHPVSKLRRVSIGPVTARGLQAGQFRDLAPREIALLSKKRDSRQQPRRAAVPNALGALSNQRKASDRRFGRPGGQRRVDTAAAPPRRPSRRPK